MNKTFEALGGSPVAQAAFAGELIDRIERGNRATDGMLGLPSEYLEVVVTTGKYAGCKEAPGTWENVGVTSP